MLSNCVLSFPYGTGSYPSRAHNVNSGLNGYSGYNPGYGTSIHGNSGGGFGSSLSSSNAQASSQNFNSGHSGLGSSSSSAHAVSSSQSINSNGFGGGLNSGLSGSASSASALSQTNTLNLGQGHLGNGHSLNQGHGYNNNNHLNHYSNLGYGSQPYNNVHYQQPLYQKNNHHSGLGSSLAGASASSLTSRDSIVFSDK